MKIRNLLIVLTISTFALSSCCEQETASEKMADSQTIIPTEEAFAASSQEYVDEY